MEFNFLSADGMEETLAKALELRALFLASVEQKLTSDDYGDSRELRRKIVKFSRLSHPFRLIFMDFKIAKI